MSFDYTLEQIESLRDLRYHRTPELRSQTEEQALAFINEVGFCFLFGDAGVEMPTLWGTVTGSRRPVPLNHRDGDLGRTWRWKDSLPTQGAAYYGKLLRGKPTLVALSLLPTFYALTPNYGDVDDYLLQYEEGKLSVEAKNVYEALLHEGALATSRLRQVAGLPGGGDNARRFDRALTELQTEMKIVKVGVSDANRWGYAYVYDLFLRRFPEVPEAARYIGEEEAMATLLVRYLRNVIAVHEASAKRLFRWESWEWDRVVARAESQGLIFRDVRIAGMKGRCLATTQL
jgi:hypothetical protein